MEVATNKGQLEEGEEEEEEEEWYRCNCHKTETWIEMYEEERENLN